MTANLQTACLTVLTGVAVLTLGRFVQVVLLDPLTEYRKVLGKIQYNLWRFRNEYDFPWDQGSYTEDDVSAEYRATLIRAGTRLNHCASLLLATTSTILGYRLWVRAGWMPSKAEIKRAAILLGCIAAECRGPSFIPDEERHAVEYMEEVRRLLRLEDVRSAVGPVTAHSAAG